LSCDLAAQNLMVFFIVKSLSKSINSFWLNTISNGDYSLNNNVIEVVDKPIEAVFIIQTAVSLA